jgi:hypothetical protein
MSSLNPYFSTHRRQRSRSAWTSELGLRIRVLCRRRRLDTMLAEGADPAASPELALRSRRLTSEPYRRVLADSLDEVLCVAEGRGPRVSASPPLAHREVRAARAALLDLSRALRQHTVVNASGVVLAQRLLTDGAGPLYIESRNDELWRAARGASAALDTRA